MYTINNRFEWDDVKAIYNAQKHGIDFLTAADVFNDPFALVLKDEKHSLIEVREWIIGESELGILIVVFTTRALGRIRIISARQANNKERALYEQNKRI